MKYKLEFNTCNLGVYTRIYVYEFIDEYMLSGVQDIWPYVSTEGALLKDCNGLTNGCPQYPGTVMFDDTTDYSKTGDGFIIRVNYPQKTYTYSKYTATWDLIMSGTWYKRVVYQFLRGQIYFG